MTNDSTEPTIAQFFFVWGLIVASVIGLLMIVSPTLRGLLGGLI